MEKLIDRRTIPRTLVFPTGEKVLINPGDVIKVEFNNTNDSHDFMTFKDVADCCNRDEKIDESYLFAIGWWSRLPIYNRQEWNIKDGDKYYAMTFYDDGSPTTITIDIDNIVTILFTGTIEKKSEIKLLMKLLNILQ